MSSFSCFDRYNREKRMKKKNVLQILSAMLCLAYFAGCQNGILLERKESTNDSKQEYGSLVVKNASSDRALVISELKFANITVTGTDISIGNEPSAKVDINNGAGSFIVDKIPVGKNRVVTVQALDTNSSKINDVRLRAVVDITPGENEVLVNWSTTALGNVFESLHERGIDISSISDSNKTAIENAIDKNVHASFINAATIAADYEAKGVSGLKAKSNYVLTPAKLVFSYTQAQSYKVQVTDPCSVVTTCSAGENTISGIAPGTWKLIITDNLGTVLYTKSLNVFTANSVLNLGSLDPKKLTDIVVHAKSPYKYIWSWPEGADGTLASLKDEGNGWYGYTFENTSSINIIFRPNGGNDWNGQTADLKLSACGEYWYYNGEWYTSNPEDTVKPTITSFTADKSGSVSGSVRFTIAASDNSGLSKVVLAYDTTTIQEASLTGLNDSVVIDWDTSKVKNGTYSVKCVVYDGANNVCESNTMSFTTNNANLPPVAVIKGQAKAKVSSVVSYSCGSYDQNGGEISSWNWSVTGASITSGQGTKEIKVQMPSSEKATVNVSLTVTDEEGASASTTFKTETTNGTTGDFREETIYFLMTTRFYDGDKSNNEYCWDEGGEYLKFSDGDCAWRGDFKGLAQKLDYIKALGFSAVWITPVVENASGIDYHGYHAYDFSKVDPRYESTGFTYQDLIDACHSRGIKVIQDIVLNHTGNFGERNLFHMFDKETTPYVNKDVATPAGGKRSPFMKVAKDGNAYSKLMSGLSMAGASNYDNSIGDIQYKARINAMKEDSIDTGFIYHHTKTIDWNSENCQLGQMAGDCVDLNTENPIVYNYLIDCYNKYIDMGVDGFRIDTVKHISRLTFNKTFIPAFKERGGDDFFIFGETCARYRGRWNEGVPALSPSFYTWKETDNFTWSDSSHATNSASATAHFTKYRSNFTPPHNGTANHLLKGNNYHTPDWSKRSYLDQIDFPMHWAFNDAGEAFRTAVGTNDPDFNDATFNVTYVDSHDYAPDNAPESQRYTGYWPDKLNLMFTFRGIPCIYYGSEIEFMKGAPIDPANIRTSCNESGRAYFGDYLEGTINASDYGEYSANGVVASTLKHDLAQHIIRLNKIRRAIPALQKGQYSTEGCSGSIAFKRRYTNTSEGVDSFACVAINGSATFSGIPSGTYTEVITGKTVSCNGSISSENIGQGNMRVYVLNGPGKIGTAGAYLK